MPQEEPHTRMRGLRGWAAAAAFLLLALLGIRAALRLASPAWVMGADRDPLISMITGRSGSSDQAVDLEDLEAAARRSVLDFRYPYRLARAIWIDPKDSRNRTQLVKAHEALLETTRRAPTYAPARFYLSWTSYELGRTDLADEQAQAALELAPMHQDIRRRVLLYFTRRFRASRSRAHLKVAVRAMGGASSEGVRSILADPLLTFEEVKAAFAAASIQGADEVALLEKAERWDWAIRVAAGLDGDEVSDRASEARSRLRYAGSLLSRGAKDAARDQAEAALDCRRGAFETWDALGRFRLAASDVEGGIRALEKFIDSGGDLGRVREAMREGDIPPARRLDFWQSVEKGNRGSALVTLELARAQLHLGHVVLCEELLRTVLEAPGVAAEANFLLATAFRSAGSPEMGLKYARRAVELEEDNEDYQRLLEKLEGEAR